MVGVGRQGRSCQLRDFLEIERIEDKLVNQDFPFWYSY